MSTNTDQERLSKIILTLDRVRPEVKQMVFEMAQGMTDLEIIQSFNQQALDLFTLLNTITVRLNRVNEFKIGGYKLLFDNAIKQNVKLPLDKFTLIILEFAPEIYDEKETCFMDMSIPDTNVTVGNEFSIIRSDMFKKLWKILDNNDKDSLKNIIIPLTTYAHAYLYKTVLKYKK